MSDFNPQSGDSVITRILDRLDQQDALSLKERTEEASFRASCIDQLNAIKEQTTKTNGRVTWLESDAVRWSRLLPNKDNWKAWGAFFMLLVTSQIGARLAGYAVQFFEHLAKLS